MTCPSFPRGPALLLALLIAAAPARGSRADDLFAERLDATNVLQRRVNGPDAVGGIGDFALGDGVVCALVSDPGHENELAARGGVLMDLGRCARADDQFLAVEPMANLSLRKMIPIESVTPERDATSARIITRGERDGIALETIYAVRAAEPGHLFMTTRIERRAEGESFFALGLAFANVGALRPFLVSTQPGGATPGFTGAAFIGRGVRAAAAAAVPTDTAVLVGEDALLPGVSYAVRLRAARLERESGARDSLPAFMLADDLATIFAVFARPFWWGGETSLGIAQLLQSRLMDLATGDALVVELDLAVGERADVASALESVVDGERALLRGKVDDAGARLHLDRADGTPATELRPNADGTFAARVAPGDYRLRVVAAGGRETSRTVSLSSAGVDLGLVAVEPPARIRLPRGHAMRLVFLGQNGTQDPRFGDDLLGYRVAGMDDVKRTAAVRELALSGTSSDPESVVVGPGRYRVLATRGPEYDVTDTRIEARAGQTVALDITPPPRVLETPGWISADFHVHAAPSPDSALPAAARVASYVAEGAEVLISTEHDMIADYAPLVAELGLASDIATIVGVEVTSEVRTPIAPHTTGHANAFPVTRDPLAYRGGAVRNEGRRWREILGDLRAQGGERVVQLNHPRSKTLNPRSYFTHLASVGEPYDPAKPLTDAPNRVLLEQDPATGFRDIDFDAIELLNGERMESYTAVRTDWFSLLRQGVVLAGTANSDSHRLGTIVAAPRNYVPVQSDAIDTFDAAAFVHAVRDGRSFGTTGPLLDVQLGDARAGDHFVGTSGDLVVRVRAAPWIPVSTLRVFVNGETAAETAIRAEQPATIPLRFDHDAFVSVEVEGAPGEIYRAVLPDFRPFAFSNPVYVDADGDGRWTPPGIAVAH